MTSPTLFDQTEPTVLAELERAIINHYEKIRYDSVYPFQYHVALAWVLVEIDKHKTAEIDQLRKAFAEGGAIPQSAESWVKKFSQGGG